MSNALLYNYFPSYLPQIHINDVVNGAHFKFAVSVPVSGSSGRFGPSVLDLTPMALYSFGHTLRVAATPHRGTIAAAILGSRTAPLKDS